MLKRLLAVLFLASGMVLAVPLKEVRIEGAGPVLTALARIALPVSVGDEVTEADLEAVRAAVLETGYFTSAEVRLENDVLVVHLQPNPPIRALEVAASAFPPETLTRLLGEELALGPGATFNPKRAQEGANRIGAFYRAQGFPFTPEVRLEVAETPEGVTLKYTVEESPPVTAVTAEGATLIPEAEVRAAFEPLVRAGKFEWEAYRQAVQTVNRRYFEEGFRGSGVNPAETQLVDGTLHLRIQELKLAEVDATALGEAPITLEPGTPFNYEQLLDEVARLSRALGQEVRFQLEQVAPDQVRVVLSPSTPRFGVIREVQIQGVSAFPLEKIRAALRLGPGDVYVPELAQEDYGRIVRLYQEAGLEVRPQPDVSFQDGVYTLRVHEIRIGGYRLEWDGPHRTRDEVVLRELPPAGSVLSVQAVREGITNLLRTGLFDAPPAVRTAPGASPDEVVLVLELSEARTGVFAPAIGWSSLEGWSGQATLTERNLFGLAHQVSVDVVFGENEAQDNFSLRASYRIPWLFVDFADLKEVRTSLDLSLFTVPVPNIPLTDANGQDTGWEFTERRTGFRLTVGRPFSKDLKQLRVFTSVDAEFVQPKLEVLDPEAPSSPSEAEATAMLPTPYQSYTLGLSARFSTADSPDFPTEGIAASASSALGLVFPEGGEPAQFVPLSATLKTYAALDEPRQQVLAFRVAAGTVLGEPPESRLFHLGGSEPEISLLRGYENRAFSGTNLLGGSVEYRYDFGLRSSVTQTLVGIVFVDVGSVWNPGEDPVFFGGYGVGLQLNLGFGGVFLPPIRLDYGFSPTNPNGVLHFRLGPVF